MMDKLKACTKCTRTLPVDRFHKESRRIDGRQAWCQDCANQWRRDYLLNASDEILENRRKNRRDYYRDHREVRLKAIRNTELKRKYGITLDQYTALLEAQEKRCGLCGSLNPGFRENFAVDHDHDSTDVRGLLCDRCNRYLGIYEKMLRMVGSVKLDNWLSAEHKAEVKYAMGKPRCKTPHPQSEISQVAEDVESCGQQYVN